MSYVKLTSIQSDADTQITRDRARVYDVYGLASGSAGFLRLRDGSATGPVLFEVITSGTADDPFRYEFPRYGIPFNTHLWMEASNLTSATLVFDGTLVPLMELVSGDFLHFTDGAPFELVA